MLHPLLASLALVAAPWTTELLERPLPDGSLLLCEVTPGPDGEPVEHGPWELRDAAGVARVKGEMEHGSRAGTWRWRYPDEELAVSGKFKGGLRIGAWRFRYPDGQKLAEGRYKNGKRAGDWEFYLPDGSRDPARSGEFTWFERGSTPGGPEASGYMLGGLREGRWTYRWPHGGLQLRADFHAGGALDGWDFRHVDGTSDPEFFALLAAPGAGIAFPEFVARDLDAEPFAELMPGAASQSTGAALRARFPELPAPSWRTDDERAFEARARPALDALFETRAESGKPGESFAALRTIYGPAAFPPVLAALAALDLRQPEDVAWARTLQLAFLAPETLHAWFGWRAGTEPEDVAFNTLALQRWHSFYACTAEIPEAWDFDLALPSSAPEKGAHGPEPLFRIAAGYEPVLHEVPRVPDASFAHRRAAYEERGDQARRAELAAIESGLAWLRGRQAPDGSWDTKWFATNARGGTITLDGAGDSFHDVGVTGLVVLAQLGVGLPEPGEPAHTSVIDALRWLVSTQDPKTGILRASSRLESGEPTRSYAYEWAYGHAIATKALAEGTRVSPSPLLRQALERAVQLILAHRYPYSGWRYVAPEDVPDDQKGPQVDSSATAWMLAALHAARRAGVSVEPHAFEGGLSLLEDLTNEAGVTGYGEPGEASARVKDVNDHYPRELPTLTAVGLLARLELGQRPEEHPRLVISANLVSFKPPSYDPEGLTNDFYYWYHGARAMWLLGGEHWKRWKPALRGALLTHQRLDGGAKGSWDPNGPWCFPGGRIYATAMAVLALEASLQPVHEVDR